MAFNLGKAAQDFFGFDITPGFNVSKGAIFGGNPKAPVFGVEPTRRPTAPARPAAPAKAPVAANAQYKANSGLSYASGGGSGGGGGGAGGFDPAALAYYDDQEKLAKSGLDRLGKQKGIGYSNIDNSFNAAFNRLLGEKAVATRDYGLSKNRTIEDNRNSRDSIERGVQTQSASLKRLLGSMGAGNSSAAEVLAPYAVAKQGNQQLGDVQTRFGRNLQSLDLAKEDTEREFSSQQGDLNLQRSQKRNEFDAGLAQQEAGILEQLSNIALQRQQAKGQNYAQARSAMGNYSDRINALLGRVDSLGKQYASPITRQKSLQFAAPELSNYDTAGISLGDARPNDALSQVTNPFFQLLGNDDERRRELGY
jgi:hypothetical protein